MNTEKACPALKPDLIVSINDLSGSQSEGAVIKDPATRRYFSMTQRQLSVLRLCDGTKSLEEIADEFNKQAPRPVSLPAITRLIENMEKAGLFRSEEAGSSPPTQSGASALLRKLLFVKIKTFDPDILLRRALRYVQPFFTAQFVAIATTLILAALSWVFLSPEFIKSGMMAIRPAEFAIGWALCFIIAIFHEMAHGFACKHWGGEVKSMGLLFIYFNPALYCDVSDAWLFSRRSERLWTMAAGGFFESFAWALMVGARVLLPLSPSGLRICNFMILFTGIKIIINLNPLIKLDGYYVLSDALAIPNLRSRSFKYSRELLKRYFLRSGSMPAVSRKEAVSFLLYCALAGPFSLWLGVTMFWRGVSSVASHHWRGGWILIAVLVLVAMEPLLSYAGWLRREMINKRDSPGVEA